MKQLISTGILLLCLSGGLAAQALQGKTVYITVKRANLKESTGFFARVRGTLQYGDACTVLREQGRWVEVRSASGPSLQGWIASANVSTRRVVSSSTSASASADELALAGKGFSEEVERSYRAEGDLDYTGIDNMEQPVVNTGELRDFIVEGHLAGAE
ncbi:MAG: SH3 domain-containing protein [Spirochaetaceae bacterium]|jgi:uncharacterized protein YgiM (DUF1202 family)|nr:SH3 domain-containing protein [Spirochaetaceae bacterium]